MISSLKLPSTVALCARRCERSPKASCASRVMPCILPSISAVRPIMPDALAAYRDCCGLGSTPCIMPTWPMCSTPPTTNTSPLLVWMACTAVCRALMEEPHRRLTVCALLVCGMRVSKEAMRAMFQPCSRVWLTQPQMTSSTSAGLMAALRASRLSIRWADMFSARVLRCMPPLERPIGVRPKSTMTASLGFKLLFYSPVLLTKKGLAVFRHFTQFFGRMVERAQLGVLVCQRDKLGHADAVDVAQRTATERRETDAVNQAHIGFCGGLDNAVFQAAYGFQTQRNHHVVDDVLVGQLALLVNDGSQHVGNGRIHHLFRLALLVSFVGVEALAVFLAQTLGAEQHVNTGVALFFHAIREAFG